MRRATFLVPLLVCFVVVESLLLLRVWLQATAQDIDDNTTRGLFGVTHDLAAPFALLTGESPRDETGVIDFTVLVAINGYFVAALALVALVSVMSGVVVLGRWGIGRAGRRSRAFPDEPATRILWQPRRCSRAPEVRLYVPFVRRTATRAGANAAFMGKRRVFNGP